MHCTLWCVKVEILKLCCKSPSCAASTPADCFTESAEVVLAFGGNTQLVVAVSIELRSFAAADSMKLFASVAILLLATASAGATRPPAFLWGSATASYQIEGAVKADGRGATE